MKNLYLTFFLLVVISCNNETRPVLGCEYRQSQHIELKLDSFVDIDTDIPYYIKTPKYYSDGCKYIISGGGEYYTIRESDIVGLWKMPHRQTRLDMIRYPERDTVELSVSYYWYSLSPQFLSFEGRVFQPILEKRVTYKPHSRRYVESVVIDEKDYKTRLDTTYGSVYVDEEGFHGFFIDGERGFLLLDTLSTSPLLK